MSTLISRLRITTAVLAGAMLLAACQKAPTSEEATDAPKAVSPVEAVKGWVAGMSDERPRIYCAIGAAAALAQDCRVEVIEDARGRMLLLSRPDGGFRRIRLAADNGMSAADGAAEPKFARSGNIAGILFENERYAVPMNLITPAMTR